MRRLLFCGIVICIFLIIIIYPGLQIIDDHGLLDSLMSGSFFTKYISESLFSIGRFYPLNMQEFNLLTILIGRPDVRAFYLLIGLQFLAVSWILCRLSKPFLDHSEKNHGVFLLLSAAILSPGFATAFLRLHIGERNVLFFFLLFLFFFIHYQEKKKWFYAAAGLISANLSLYYKEPVFLMLGAFAFFYLLFNWKNMNPKQKSFNALLIASSLAFLVTYYLIVYSKMTGIRYGVSDLPTRNLMFLRALINMVLNDPLLFLISATAFYRLLDFWQNRAAEPLYDSMLLSSLAYISSFIILRMSLAYHYSLPAYAPGVLALGYFLFKKNYKAKSGMRLAIFLTAFIFCTNTLPATLHTISHYKNTTTNFQETLDFLEGYIKKHDHRVRIFLDGVNRGSDVEVYHSFIKYMNFRGLSEEVFDLLSDEEPNSAILFSARPDSPYTVHQSSATFEPLIGDLLLISPYSIKGASPEHMNDLSRNCELLFRTTSFLPIPLFTTKEAIRWMLMKVDIHLMAHTSARTMDYYVFKKTK